MNQSSFQKEIKHSYKNIYTRVYYLYYYCVVSIKKKTKFNYSILTWKVYSGKKHIKYIKSWRKENSVIDNIRLIHLQKQTSNKLSITNATLNLIPEDYKSAL